MNNDLELFTQKEFNKKAEAIFTELSENIISKSNKQAFVLGGQPASGKSSLIEKYRNELNKNVIVINADSFRKYHPRFKEIEKDSSLRSSDDPRSNSSTRTGVWSGKMSEAILRKSVEKGYNIIIEGTFRTSEIPIKTLEELKNNGYETTVAIKTCPKEESYQSTIERYQKEKELTGYGRLTPKEHHFKVVENLSKNSEIVYQSKLADNFYVESRKEVLFDSKTTNEHFKSSIIQNELNKNEKQLENKNSISDDVFNKALSKAKEKVQSNNSQSQSIEKTKIKNHQKEL